MTPHASSRSPHSGRAAARLFAAVLLLAPGSAAAQNGPTLTQAVEDLGFREIGPTIMGGRIADIAVVESDPSTFYVGVATGGVWKTTNAGITFEPLFDDEETASIGDVTVAPSNPNVVWVGTGEPQNRQSSPWGNGVYRSTDAGRTWTHLGLEETHHIGRIVVHPRDPDVAWVAAVGHLWGPNPERGVYRTTDGGRTWEKVLFIDDDTGAIDLAMDPGDPKTIFAAMYQRRRRAWGFNGGGPGSGLYRTTDGGETWHELTEGLPSGDKGRIGVDVYRRDPGFVCAVVEADARGGDGGDRDGPERNGVYCSSDRGETWEHRSTTNNRPMYYSQIRIDPNDPQRIYLGGSRLYVSEDGGRTFRDDAAADVHPDHHALWIDPANSSHLLLGSDGGMSVSWDRSRNWFQFMNLPLAQFYEIGVDSREPYHVCGGLQDNGSWCAPSDTWSNQGVRTRDWYNVGSGDGFFTVMHPTDPSVMFAESQNGNLMRVDLETGERARLRPLPRPAAGEDEADDLRWNWNTPALLSAHDPSTLYYGGNVLFRSSDLGQSWERVSPDLTYAVDRDTLALMGVRGSEPMMSKNDGQSSYGNLVALAESPLDRSVLYTGADDGRLHVTRDGGATWTDISDNLPGLPRYTYVTRIVASHHQPGTVFAAFDGHRSDDFAPYVYRSEDFGRSWRRIAEGLPQSSLNALAEHPRTRGLLFVGNEVGAYLSADGGASWTRLGGLPTVPVDDIKIHPRDNDLILGTHGRGVWILDDIGPLQGLTADVMASRAHLFPPRAAVLYNPYRPQGWTPGVWAAATPPPGARIRFWLGEWVPGDSVTVSIAGPDGAVLREMRVASEPGLNEVLWDLTLEEKDAGGEAMSGGPPVLPGTYIARLEAGGARSEAPVEVRLDPRARASRADLQARHDAMLRAYRLSASVDRAEDALERLRGQLEDVEGLVDGAARPDAALRDRVATLLEEIDALEEDLDDAGNGVGFGAIASVTGPPTADQLWAVDRSYQRVPAVIERVNTMITERVPALYRDVYQPGAAPDPGPVVRWPGG